MPEALEHRESYQSKYLRIKDSMRALIDNNPDIPEDLEILLKKLLAEEYFDTSEIKMRLLDYPENWAQDIITLILSLESNEAFVDAQRK